MYFIGIDIGTTSICGTKYDISKHITDTLFIKNEAGIESPNPSQKLQDPDWIVNCVLGIVKKFESATQPIQGIGVTGQMHGILYLDKDGNAVSPLHTWQDNSGNQIFNNGHTYAEFLTAYTGHHLSTGYGLVTHFYHLKNALVPHNATKLCTIMDYVVMKLTNRKTPVTDYTNAAGLGFFNTFENKFDTTSLKNVGIDPAMLPDINESAILTGHYDSGIPVYAAIGDNQASFIGSVENKNNSIHITIGTSSQLSVYSDMYLESDILDTRPFPGGGYLLVGAALSGGQSLAVLKSLFDTVLQSSKHDSLDDDDFYQMINTIDYVNNGDGLSVGTLFNGSRNNPFSKGSISNISTTNFTAKDLILGFMNGICEEVYQFYHLLPEELKKNRNILIGAGNAIKKNPLLCKALQDTFQLPMIMSAHEEDAAIGACYIAMMQAGYKNT